MAETSPTCNVTAFVPAPKPVTPKGYRLIPANATLSDVINIVNQNFSPTTQVQVFNQLVRNDITNNYVGQPGSPGARGPSGKPGESPDMSQLRQMVRQEIGRVNFKQFAIVRKKVKVTNPDDKEQYVMDDRVINLVMRDSTGATWTFNDPKAEEA